MHEETLIRTRDGEQINVQLHVPALPNGKVVIIAPTASFSRSFYEPISDHYCKKGYTVVNFEYRGMDKSSADELKGYQASMHQWAVQDIDAVILFVRNRYKLHEIIYIGHCIGGEIVGLAQASQYINRLVLVNSALSCKRYWRWRDRFRVFGSRLFIKACNFFFGYFPGSKLGYKRDMPGGVMGEWASWCHNPNGLFDAYPDHNYQKLQIPLLAFSFTDDWHCPPFAVRELLNHFSNAQVKWLHMRPQDIEVTKIGHGGFFQPVMKEKLWAEVDRWLQEGERAEKKKTSLGS